MKANFQFILAITIIIFTVINVNCIMGNDNDMAYKNSSHINNTTIEVVQWGCISGIVVDKDGKGIPNAEVTLWKYGNNNASGKNENLYIMNISDNPHLTQDGRAGSSGLFTFNRVPEGTYNITVKKDDSYSYKIVDIKPGTYTYIIPIDDYQYTGGGISDKILPTNSLSSGKIWGIVLTHSGVNVGDANVTLWHSHYNSVTREWENDGIVNVNNNPQLSSNGSRMVKGAYEFSNVPQGTYNMSAEKSGHSYYSIVNLTDKMSINFITLYDYSGDVIYRPGEI